MYKKFNLLIILTIILSLSSIERSFAQWKKIERPEIKVPISTYSVAAKGDTLFVGTYRSTIYRSTDNGVVWTKSDSGITFIYWIYDFLIDGNMIYAMGEEGIFRSSNMGETWELKNNGLHASLWMNVYSMAKSGDLLFAATDFGVYRSPNNGDNWYPTNSDSSYCPIYSLAVLNGSLFAGSAEKGVFRSTDNGLTWNAINDGMPYNSINYTKRINKLFVDGGNIYAGTNQWGVYYSSDNGNMWLPDIQGLKLKNNGWHYPVYSIAKIENYIYAGTQDDGIYRHSGTTGIWTKVNTNLPDNSYITSIIRVETKIFAATHDGLYYSSMDSIAWIPALTEFPNKVNIFHLGASGNNLFISTFTDYYNGSINEVFYTPNAGNTWFRDSVLSKYYIHDFQSYGDSLYAYGSGLFFSSNNGPNWVEIDSNSINTFIKNNDTLFVGLGRVVGPFEFGNIFLSANNGESWNEIWNKDTAVYAIEKIANNIFAGTSYGIYRSTNTGLSWTPINTGLPGVYVGSFNTLGNNLFLCSNFGIYLSTNYGNNWIPVNNGLPVDTLGSNLLHLLTYKNQLYAGTYYGIYFSTNLGESWIPINDELNGDNLSIRALTVNGNDLVIATGNGLWKRSISEINSVKNDNGNFPKEYYLFQNYPNPFNSRTTIDFDLSKTSEVTLKIFNILGEEAATIVSDRLTAGSYTYDWDAGNLASGVYLYRLQAGDYVETRKMVLMK